VRKRGHNQTVIRRLSRNDLHSVRALLAQANDAPYDIATVAEEKCFGRGFEGEAVATVYGDFDGMAVTCGKHLRLMAVDRQRRRRGIGRALLRDAESRGARVIAAEPGNYFTPGVVAADHSTLAFFQSLGYGETARTQNLEAELPAGEGAGTPPRSDRREDVLNFIEHHFGPIWRFEASLGATIFYVEHEGQIAGFSTHDANNRGLGFFGPTGVAPQWRGRGFGRQLLLASLADLGSRGYRRAVIPWTEAIDFYRNACGARIAHHFVILRRIAA
jgi:GNAT superfamily N-acetyltransferase